MVVNVHQMVGQVRKKRCQILDAGLFKGHVVGRGADVQRDVLAKPLRQGAAWIGAGIGQEFLVLQLAALPLDVVQGILEGDLHERLAVVVGRDRPGTGRAGRT